MKLDFCSMVTHKREWNFLPIHFNSIKAYMPDDWSNFRVCVDIDDQDTINYCKQYPILDMLKCKKYVQVDKPGGMKQDGYDTANRMDKLMKVCTSDWVVLSHLDIVFTGNMIEAIMPFLNENYGVIGFWPLGCTIVNRKAYEDMHYGFWPITCLTVEILSDLHARLCGVDTPRDKARKSYGLLGIDTGVFITMEMPVYGFRHSLPPFVGGWHNYYYHIGGLGHAFTEGERDLDWAKEIFVRRDKALETFASLRGEI